MVILWYGLICHFDFTFLDWTDLNFQKHSSLNQFGSRCALWVVLFLFCFMFLGVVSVLGVTGFGRFLSWFVCHVLVSVRELHFPACSPQPFTKDSCFHGPGKFGVCLQWHRSRRYFQRTLNCKKETVMTSSAMTILCPTFILALVELIGVLRFSPSYCDYVVWGMLGS